MLNLKSWLRPAASRPRALIPQAGFFSIEMIIVLVVALSILSASAGRVAGLFSASSSTALVSSLLELQNNVRTLKPVSGYGADGDSLVQPLIDAQLVPNGLTVNGSAIFNDWNGAVDVNAINNGIGFSITLKAVPQAVCSKIINQMLSSGNFTGIGLDGKLLKKDSSLTDISSALSSIPSEGAEVIFYVDSEPSQP